MNCNTTHYRANSSSVPGDPTKVVETQYSERADPSDEEARLRRFSNGEIQYLLGDYQGAAVFFYDLVSDKGFKAHPRYEDAVFYLADSLYRQKNYVGAKPYLRELISLGGARSREALTRSLEIAGRRNEHQGVEELVNKARAPSGSLPPDVEYVYAKWIFNRRDLSAQERTQRGQQVFARLAGEKNPFQLPAAYFVGVAHVKLKEYPQAIERFLWIAGGDQPPPNESDRDRDVREMANLSLGRLFHELGRYDEALDRYSRISRESPQFADSLYEIAWTHVKKGEFEKAKNATDILLLVAPDSTLAPEAQILQGHLLLKLKRYDRATETYGEVINNYAPVRDELDALLGLHKDPVRYFDDLLARSDQRLDVATLLPPVALKWATTERDVADAVQVVSELEQGRRGVSDGRETVDRLLRTLNERAMESFPALQEGYVRADAVLSALTHGEAELTRVERALIEPYLTPTERQELDQLTRQEAGLRERFDQLPTNEKQLAERRRRMQLKAEQLDRQAFKLGYEIQSMNAAIAAIEKWVEDTRTARQNSPEEEKAFLARVRTELGALAALQKDLELLRQTLADERSAAEAMLGGEDEIRRQYGQLMVRQHQLISAAEGRLSGDEGRVLVRSHEMRGRIDAVRERADGARAKLRQLVEKKAAEIRESLTAEKARLDQWNNEVNQVSADAGQLLGRIALDSFRRVRAQFYDLVLKADVGIVDVAFRRKQEKTGQIQTLASQKDRELNALDQEFTEVLKEVQ